MANFIIFQLIQLFHMIWVLLLRSMLNICFERMIKSDELNAVHQIKAIKCNCCYLAQFTLPKYSNGKVKQYLDFYNLIC